jgi:hypothetical protein
MTGPGKGAQGAEDEIQEEVVIGSGLVRMDDVDRASVDVQVSTAKKYPRSITKSLKEAMDLATLDAETAASCFYALPRAGKTIEGPSARLAEIMAYSWGNLRVDAGVVGDDATHVTAQGTCFDLEKNVAVRVRVRRRITDRNGKRLNDDMIVVTGNAATSIALRNSVFKVIPAALTQRIYQAARAASVGQAGTLAQTRQNAMAWFAKAGVVEAQVFKLLGVQGLDDIGTDELITLRGVITAIRDGDTTVEGLIRNLDGEDDNERTAARTKERQDKLREQLEAKKRKPASGAPSGSEATDKDGTPAAQPGNGEKAPDVASTPTPPPAAEEPKDRLTLVLESLEGMKQSDLHKHLKAEAKRLGLDTLSDLNAIVKRVLKLDTYQAIATAEQAAEVILDLEKVKSDLDE